MSSPQTPRHSRQSSAMDAHPESPLARQRSNDTASPYRSSFNREDTLDLNELRAGGGDADAVNSMGNLADELADAFSESGGEDEFDSSVDVTGETEDFQANGGTGVEGAGDESLSLPHRDRKNHRRKVSAYDGSDYGPDSDLDSSGLPPALVVRIDAIESLARRGTESYGQDDVVKRVTEALRDLGSQSSVEGSASRLITAHSALTTHLAHQTRQVHSLAFPLLSAMAPIPDPEAVDDLIPLLLSLSDEMPRPSTAAFDSLAALHSITADLVQTLNYLSDTLHMSRQTTSMATRRLKSAKDLVVEMRKDEELREEGERWLTRENWGERLQKRECAGVCRDVIGGFEEVCNGWRERLLAQAEAQG